MLASIIRITAKAVLVFTIFAGPQPSFAVHKTTDREPSSSKLEDHGSPGAVLVTGGAGYIGSHTVYQLHDAGENVIVLDNLSTGNHWAIPADVRLIIGDIGDEELVGNLIKEFHIKSVIHFAAFIQVEESVKEPIKYYENNFVNAMRLIKVCDQLGVKHFIFSSTCAVYGDPVKMPVSEDHQTSPLNPYAMSKLLTETLLRDLSRSGNSELRHVVLRYFNVAGARISGEIGLANPDATQLIKVACEAATGKRKALVVNGDDYATQDGTCIRDFIHVEDLANAHILALKYLRNGGKSELLNCGYGDGYSVKQVAAAVEKVSGKKLPLQVGPRRTSDIVKIWADPTKIKSTLNWSPTCDNLILICKTSYDWELRYQSLCEGQNENSEKKEKNFKPEITSL